MRRRSTLIRAEGHPTIMRDSFRPAMLGIFISQIYRGFNDWLVTISLDFWVEFKERQQSVRTDKNCPEDRVTLPGGVARKRLACL